MPERGAAYLVPNLQVVVRDLVDSVLLEVLKVGRLQEIRVIPDDGNDWEADEQKDLPPVLRSPLHSQSAQRPRPEGGGTASLLLSLQVGVQLSGNVLGDGPRPDQLINLLHGSDFVKLVLFKKTLHALQLLVGQGIGRRPRVATEGRSSPSSQRRTQPEHNQDLKIPAPA